MKPKDWEVLLCTCLLATAVRHTHADANSFFNSLGDTFRDAGQTIAQGTQRAYSVVKNDTIDAAQATDSAFRQAGDTVASAAKDVYNQSVQFARQEWNGTQRAINTVEGALQDATSDLNSTVVDFKMSALNEMRPAWEDVQRGANSFANSSVAVVSQGVYGVVHFGNKTWTSLQAAGTPALAPASGPTQDAVDATNPSSLMAAVASTSNREYTDAARSIIVAIAANRSREVSAAVGSVVLSAYAENNTQVPLGLSEAFAMSMLASNEAFVNHTAAVTPTAVAQTLVAGLQAAVANCTSGLQTSLQPQSAGWYKFYASNCCGPVTPMVGDMSLIMQQVPSDAVSNAWFKQLGRISQYRTQPTFDLARCLAQDQNAVNVSVS